MKTPGEFDEWLDRQRIDVMNGCTVPGVKGARTTRICPNGNIEVVDEDGHVVVRFGIWNNK